jgi:hypothetical protein
MDIAQRYLTADNYRKQVNQSLKDRIKEGWFLSLYSKQVESDALQIKFSPRSAPLNERHPH